MPSVIFLVPLRHVFHTPAERSFETSSVSQPVQEHQPVICWRHNYRIRRYMQFDPYYAYIDNVSRLCSPSRLVYTFDDPTIATSDPIANYEEHDIERCCIGISGSLTRDLFDRLDHLTVLASQLRNLGTCFYSLFVLYIFGQHVQHGTCVSRIARFDSCVWRHL